MSAREDRGQQHGRSEHTWRRVRTSDRMLIAGAAFAGAALAAAGGAPLAHAGEGAGPQGASGGAGVGGTPLASPSARAASDASAYVKVHNVQGRFSFTQNVVTPTARMVRDLGGTSTVLCPDSADAAATGIDEAWEARLASSGSLADALAGTLEVGGLVRHPVRSPLGELTGRGGLESRLMAYTCADNPPDGRATANAMVDGVDLVRLIDQAAPESAANVARLVSADGYEVRVPLDYLLSHGAMVVCQVNGLPASQVVGATTQLWIGATAARYNVRDLARVVVERVEEDQVPPAPGSAASGDGYTNRPNVGALGALAGAAGKEGSAGATGAAGGAGVRGDAGSSSAQSSRPGPDMPFLA